jgi:hypothetical protein
LSCPGRAVCGYDDAPDAELDAVLPWHAGVALGHAALNVDGTAQRVHDAAKLGQHPIPGVLDDPATVFGDLRIDERPQMILKLDVRAFFVRAGKPAVSGYVGRQDCGQAPL